MLLLEKAEIYPSLPSGRTAGVRGGVARLARRAKKLKLHERLFVLRLTSPEAGGVNVNVNQEMVERGGNRGFETDGKQAF